MKRHLVIIAAILALAPSASAGDPRSGRDKGKHGNDQGQGGLGGGPGQFYSKDEVLPKAMEQFAALKTSVQERYGKEHPEFADYVVRTEQRFKARIGDLPDRSNNPMGKYTSFEIGYLSGLFDKVILPQLEATFKVVSDANLPPEKAKVAVDQIAMPLMVQAENTFRASYSVTNAPAYQKMVASLEHADAPKTAGTAHGAAASLPVGAEAEGHSDDSTGEKPESPKWPGFDEMMTTSHVVKLGVSAANYSVKPTPDPPPVDPVKPPSGGGTGGGQIPPPKPTNPQGGGGQGGATIEDLIHSIAANAGTQVADRGAYELQRGNYPEAARMARMALRYQPDNRSALAVLHSAEGRAGAMGASNGAMAAAGAGAFGPSGFAGGGGAAGARPEIAAAALSGAAKVASDQARAGAMSALKLGDPKSAIEILTKALAENPANPALLNLRAQTYGRVGRWDEALKDAVAGLQLAPGNMVLLNTKALSENRTRRWRDAIATADMMIAADPNNAWAYANRAHAWGGLGDREAMLADINRAAALDPRFRKAADDAALVQVPSDSDVVFLFPGEAPKPAAAAPASAGRARSFGVVAGAGIAGGLLLALGLLSTVMRPLKDTVVAVFTRVDRKEPSAPRAVATAQPASVAGEVGGLIRGQYEISRQIGAGGMGMVYEGTDRSLGRRVAIKKMREELRVNARERDRFIIEAKTVASLHHPNIVDIYAIAEEGDDVYLVFEFVDGRTVHDLVQSKGRLEAADAARVTRAMGEALAYAHAHGVIHRDMKPSNVMVTGDGRIKVMDFGIARMAKDALTRYSMTNTVVGTPPYMAPEQEQGVVRKESDVYSLGICAYEMLTGKLPFIGIGAGMLMNKINMSYVPPSRAIAGLPEALDEVFLKAFQADPERRYRTPQDFVAAFEAAAGGARSGTGSA